MIIIIITTILSAVVLVLFLILRLLVEIFATDWMNVFSNNAFIELMLNDIFSSDENKTFSGFILHFNISCCCYVNNILFC